MPPYDWYDPDFSSVLLEKCKKKRILEGFEP